MYIPVPTGSVDGTEGAVGGTEGSVGGTEGSVGGAEGVVGGSVGTELGCDAWEEGMVGAPVETDGEVVSPGETERIIRHMTITRPTSTMDRMPMAMNNFNVVLSRG